MKLTLKFNLVLVSVLLVGLVIAGFFSYRILKQNAEREVVQTAGLMMESAGAMRGYTIGEIKPLLVPHMQETFFPQTVPAYAATQAFNKLREKHPEFAYKEATLNPTNLRDRASDWESDIIHEFRNQPASQEIVGVRDTPTGRSLYLARPIQIKDAGCLTCHSTADAAPRPMVALYGDDNGFGWQLDEIVGAQIVSVPMSVPLSYAWEAFLTFMVVMVGLFAAIIVALNVLLRRIVILPVMRMSEIADELSRGNASVEDFTVGGNDEIQVLGASFNRMRRSLDKAMGLLGAKTA